MKKVLIVLWRHSGRRTVLAGVDDRTVKVSFLESKADTESLQWLQASEAWVKYPMSPGVVWSPLAMAALVDDLEKAGQGDLAAEALRVFKKHSSTRRMSQLRMTMGRKILASRRTKKVVP